MQRKYYLNVARVTVILVLLTSFNWLVQASTTSSSQNLTSSFTFTPSADAYVRESYPDNNYGSSRTLYVDNIPVTHSFLRFNVQGLNGGIAQSAILRIYANSSNKIGITISTVADSEWAENSITFNNSPGIGAEINTSKPIIRNTWIEVDVSSAIFSDGIYSLAITTTSGRNTNLDSREAGSRSPQLIITMNNSDTSTVDVSSETFTPSISFTDTSTPQSIPSSTPSLSPTITETPFLVSTSITNTNTLVPTITQTLLQTISPIPSSTNTPMSVDTPTIAPTNSGDPVLVGAGDISSCSNNGDEATAKLIDGIAGTVFTAGDNAYDSGSASEYTNCYNPTWGRFKSRTKPSPGNHEYNTSGATGYYGYFGSVAGDPTQGYYSYDLGTWHIIVLNSEISTSTGSSQEKWLRQDLTDHTSVCTLAYWHEPRFSSGSTHGSNTNVQPLWQALFDYHADVVVNGHEHNYERFAPQTPSGIQDANGIREFVAGMGGGSHYGFGTLLANSVARNSDTYGVLKFTLHATSYDWQFIPEAGKTYADSGSAECIP